MLSAFKDEGPSELIEDTLSVRRVFLTSVVFSEVAEENDLTCWGHVSPRNRNLWNLRIDALCP